MIKIKYVVDIFKSLKRDFHQFIPAEDKKRMTHWTDLYVAHSLLANLYHCFYFAVASTLGL